MQHKMMNLIITAVLVGGLASMLITLFVGAYESAAFVLLRKKELNDVLLKYLPQEKLLVRSEKDEGRKAAAEAPDMPEASLQQKLEKISGQAALAAIRAKQELAQVPVLFLSASEDMESAVANGEYAVKGFIKKPMLLQQLYESGEAVLGE